MERLHDFSQSIFVCGCCIIFLVERLHDFLFVERLYDFVRGEVK